MAGKISIMYHWKSRLTIIFFLLLFLQIKAYCQEFPPRPISVTVSVTQNLNFGVFYHGISGGSVIINPDGSRSFSGDIVLLPGVFSTGLYDVAANMGTIVSILGFNSVLTGSNGGTLELQIGSTSPASPFIITTGSTQVSIGGTIIVKDALQNPPGNYSGTFNVTFFQE